jgi:hypothetical protein
MCRTRRPEGGLRGQRCRLAFGCGSWQALGEELLMTRIHADASANAPGKRFQPRRLLIATLGAATVNYVAGCGSDTFFTSVANLMAPPIMPPAAGTGGTAGTAGIDDARVPLAGGGSVAREVDAGADDAGPRR